MIPTIDKVKTGQSLPTLDVAATNKVDILILGAFGCGAFANDPNAVAQAFRDAITLYKKRFDVIEFAIYCRDYETENYEAFNKRNNSYV